jgi:hypothetical protein
MAQHTLDESTAERVRSLHRRYWIGYSRAIEIRTYLESLLVYPKTHRMPNVALIGETNNGKTMLLENFVTRSNPKIDVNEEKTVLPVFMFQIPPEPDEGRLYNAMLERLFAGGSSQERVDSKLQRIRILMFKLETKMIIFDEFQHALAGSAMKQKRFLNAIKYLGNELQIPLVASGTPETLNALHSDPQIANRFEPMFLPKWSMGKELQRLLASIEPRLGLKMQSGLAHPVISQAIADASEGSIGEMMKLLRSLAAHAIRSGEERITEDMLRPPMLGKIGWIAPTLRTRYER